MPKKEIVTRIRDHEGTVGRSDYFRVDPRKIHIEEGHNPRNYSLPENRAHLDALKASIKEIGVQNPLLVRLDGGQIVLVSGECRLTACLELIKEKVPIESVPAMQVSANDPAQRLVIDLTSNTGKSLSQWEAGISFKKLANYGWPLEKIAATVGAPVKYVQDAIELADAAPDVKEQLSLRAVSPALAVKVVRQHGSKAGTVLKERAAAAKAAGKKTATVARSGPVTKWEQVARAIVKEIEPDIVEGENSEYMSVSTKLIKKLIAMVSETEQAAAPKGKRSGKRS